MPNPKPQQQAYPQQTPAYGTQDPGYYWGNGGAQPAAAPAPQFDPYVPPTTPSRRPANTYAADPQQAQPYAAPQQSPYPGYQTDPAAALRGGQYDQWSAAPAPASRPASDPRGYDLASYMPPQGRAQPAQDYNQLTADLATHPQTGYSDWGHQGGYAQPQGYANQQDFDTGYAQNGYAPQGYDQQQGYNDPNAHQGYDEDGYELEQPARGRKWMTIAAALVGAIVVGGGFTYAYQALLGDAANGPTPVVKSAEGPSKVKPSEPGGRQFANTDSKLLGRLGDQGGSASAGLADSDASGARKVQTLVVGRDGAIQAPSAASAPPAAEVPGVSVPVPGMTLIDVPTPGAAAPVAAAPKPQPIVVQPPAQPVQVAANEPAPAPVVPKSLNTTSEPAPEPVAEAPKPAPKPVTKTAAIPESATTAPAPSAPAPAPRTPSGLGYVAVLASVPASGTSRIDALQQFADLQQKYGGILQNKTPDVMEANLGEKGRYHRLVVGPPGSKDGANSVCSQLKSAGYTSCWIMAY